MIKRVVAVFSCNLAFLPLKPPLSRPTFDLQRVAPRAIQVFDGGTIVSSEVPMGITQRFNAWRDKKRSDGLLAINGEPMQLEDVYVLAAKDPVAVFTVGSEGHVFKDVPAVYFLDVQANARAETKGIIIATLLLFGFFFGYAALYTMFGTAGGIVVCCITLPVGIVLWRRWMAGQAYMARKYGHIKPVAEAGK